MKSSCHILKFDRLSQLFELEEGILKRIACRMIHHKEIEGALNPRQQSLTIGSSIVPEMFELAGELSFQLNSNTLLNEKLFEVKCRGAGYKEVQSIGDISGGKKSSLQKFSFLNN